MIGWIDLVVGVGMAVVGVAAVTLLATVAVMGLLAVEKELEDRRARKKHGQGC